MQDADDAMKQSCLTDERSGKAWVTWGNVLHQQLINAELKGGNSAADIDKRCAVYLLYWYKSTNTDAAAFLSGHPARHSCADVCVC